MSFLKLEQLVDRRQSLITHKSNRIPKRKTPVQQCERGIHHSATRVHLPGSTPESFARYHVTHLNWPCIGYTFTITPSRIIQTSKGPRAEISFNRNLEDLTYHVGNSNDFSLGICIAGDYRFDQLTDAAILSFTELNDALDRDNIAMSGMRGHSSYPGYHSTECPVFNPNDVLERGRQLLNKVSKSSIYKVKKGDTLYSISRRLGDISVESLQVLNDIDDPRLLKVGQLLETEDSLKSSRGYMSKNGRFRNTSGNRIFVRFNGPSIKSPVATMLRNHATIQFDRQYVSEGYLWISHVYNNRRRYTPIATYNNGQTGKLWGEYY